MRKAFLFPSPCAGMEDPSVYLLLALDHDCTVEYLGDVGDYGGIGGPDKERPVIDLHGEQGLPDVQLILGNLDHRVIVLIVALGGPLPPEIRQPIHFCNSAFR